MIVYTLISSLFLFTKTLDLNHNNSTSKNKQILLKRCPNEKMFITLYKVKDIKRSDLYFKIKYNLQENTSFIKNGVESNLNIKLWSQFNYDCTSTSIKFDLFRKSLNIEGDDYLGYCIIDLIKESHRKITKNLMNRSSGQQQVKVTLKVQ